MISYWEKQAWTHYDFLIIGGGIVGCFAALEVVKKHPKARIAILERGLFPNGASTKNAGFACFGSLTEMEADRHTLSTDELLGLIDKRRKGLEKLRHTLGDRAIGFQATGGYELFQNPEEGLENRIHTINQLLQPLLPKPVFVEASDQISAKGFNPNKVKHLISNPYEGLIHTGKMMRELHQKVTQKGIVYFAQTEVLELQRGTSHHTLTVRAGKQTIDLHTKHLGICTNAFTQRWFPQETIHPGRGCVLISKPLPKLNLEACFHYQQGYYYFRAIDNRLLIGGGRQLDFDGENTTEMGINPKIKKALIQDVNDFILPNGGFEVDMEWSGIMAFGDTKKPIVKAVDQHIVMGVRLGGMGVAIGSLIGEEVGKLLTA